MLSIKTSQKSRWFGKELKDRWVKNIVGKGEIAVYQNFLHFPTMFSKGYFLRVSGTMWQRVN